MHFCSPLTCFQGKCFAVSVELISFNVFANITFGRLQAFFLSYGLGCLTVIDGAKVIWVFYIPIYNRRFHFELNVLPCVQRCCIVYMR